MNQDISTTLGGLVVRFLQEAENQCAVCVFEDALGAAYSVIMGVGAGLQGRLTRDQMIEIMWTKFASLGLSPDQIQQLGQRALSLTPQEG